MFINVILKSSQGQNPFSAGIHDTRWKNWQLIINFSFYQEKSYCQIRMLTKTSLYFENIYKKLKKF